MRKRQFHRKLLRFDDHLIRQHGGKPYRDYRGFRVNVGNGTTKDNGYRDCYVDILDKIIDHVQAEQDRFRTVFIGRFDIVFKEETPKFDDNDYPYFDEDHPQDFREEVYVDMDGHRKMLSAFLKNVKNYLGKETSNSRNRFRNHDQVKIGWVREYGSKKSWHYHLYICLDGDRVNTWDQLNDKGLFSILDRLWKNAAGHNHYQPLHIHSDNNRKHYKNRWLVSKDKRGREQLQHAIYALSYLAKKRSKRTSNTTIKHLATHSIPKLTTPTSEQVNKTWTHNDVLLINEKDNPMTQYANYENSVLTIDDYRISSAVVTNIAEVTSAFKSHSPETLSASISMYDSPEDLAYLKKHSAW